MNLSTDEKEFIKLVELVDKQMGMNPKIKKTRGKSKPPVHRIDVDLMNPVLIGAKPAFQVEYAIVFHKENAKLTEGQIQLINKKYRGTSWMNVPRGGFTHNEMDAIFEDLKHCLPTIKIDENSEKIRYNLFLPKREDFMDIVFHPSANCPYLLKLFSEYEAGLGGVKVFVYDGKWDLI